MSEAISQTEAERIIHEYRQKMGRNGGLARWAGKSKEERSAHASAMANARHQKARREAEARLGSGGEQ